jgi:ABC-2 type transport system permease protein
MLNKLRFGANPILVKELRSRMRDSRAFITLTLVLLLLGGFSYLLYRIALSASQYSYSSMPISPQIGQALFIALAFLELMMVSAIAPAVTAGAISGEKEKLTYEMLLATPLRPVSILWGKLVSALSYVFLLIFAAIPMASLIFIFGGVTPRDMIKALVILVVVAITLGMLGLFMSAWLGRTARATVVSYLVVAALYVLPVIVYVAVGILRQAEPPRWILVASPLSALFSAVTPASGGDWNFMWMVGMGLGGNLRALTGAGIDFTGIPRPLYHYSVPLYGLITLALYYFSTHLILPTRRWRLTRKEILIALLVLLLFAGGVAGLFWASANNYERQSIFAVPPPPMGFEDSMMVETVVEERVIQAYPAPEGREADMTNPPSSEGREVNMPYPLPGESFEPILDKQEVERQSEIYAEVIRQLYLWVEPRAVSRIYIENRTEAGLTGAEENSAKIAGAVQERVSEILNSDRARIQGEALPVEVRWISSTDPNSQAREADSALLVLGEIEYPENSTALVHGTIYFLEKSMQKTYALKFRNSRWILRQDTE